MLQNRGKLSVAVRIRVDRTFPGEVAIVEALTVLANQASPIAVVAIALLVEVSAAVKQGNRVIAVVRAVRAVPREVVEASPVAEEDAPAAEAEEAVVAVAEAVVAADAGN